MVPKFKIKSDIDPDYRYQPGGTLALLHSDDYIRTTGRTV